MTIPRPEHPRPQLERQTWQNLNGTWSYAFDFGRSGRDRDYPACTGFEKSIIVPFAPESDLSGVGHKDFIDTIWYQRVLDIPSDWQGFSVFLRFGAVDFECEIFIDGESAGRHWGGTSSFSFDISRYVSPGRKHNLVIWVQDELRSGKQTGGKQSHLFSSHGCFYTRTTGIWQTVWLEAVHPLGIDSLHLIPDVDAGGLYVIPKYVTMGEGQEISVRISSENDSVPQVKARGAMGIPIFVPVADPRLWSPQDPHLYTLSVSVSVGGKVVDEVASYSGLRKVHLEGNQVFLNNEPLYQRLVLDQGFYPDGIWTAPNDQALKNDIELSIAAGFNGARLHQKVFEERFHYWADRLGYLTWGESSSWGLDLSREDSARNFLSEWSEIVTRDRNHPSIIAWSPFNESRLNADSPQHRRLHEDAYRLSRVLDPTRPVNDSSGYVHYITDLWTVHNYEQDPDKLKSILTRDPDKGPFRNYPEYESPYQNEPYIIDEFGGIKWDPSTQTEDLDPNRQKSWGYGQAPRNIEEFYDRLDRMVRNIRKLDHICGFCYTQLTDVEQEQNGVYFYDRSEKFDMEKIKKIFSYDPNVS